MMAEAVCVICFDASPLPMQSGCACRGDGGLAHVGCRVQAAASQAAQRGSVAWRRCQTCTQDFTGPMRSGLAEAWCSRALTQSEDSAERLSAEANLVRPISHQARAVGRSAVRRMPHAACHMSQAVSLSQQGKYAEAERIERKLCDILTRKLGAEHPNTLATAANLADSLTGQGRYSAAERINRKVLAIEKRVLPHSP